MTPRRSPIARSAHAVRTRGPDRIVALSFARAVKVSTGLPPHQFVLRRRIERARALLASTNSDLSIVAAQVGLTSPAQLTRAFKRLLGVSAGEFRKNS